MHFFVLKYLFALVKVKDDQRWEKFYKKTLLVSLKKIDFGIDLILLEEMSDNFWEK